MLSYSTSGSPSSPPLVFLHGLGAGKIQTISGLPHLENTHLIAPDLPGHGDSTSYNPTTYSQPPHLKLVADAGEMPQAEFEALPDFQSLLKENPPVAHSITAVYQRPDNQVLSRMWNSHPFHSLDNLKQITSPALVIYSPRDDLHPESVASTIAKALPNSQLSSVPARYHEPEDYQKSLNQKINQFLNHST